MLRPAFLLLALETGNWVEQIDGTRPPVTISTDGQWSAVVVPSNYGGVYKRT